MRTVIACLLLVLIPVTAAGQTTAEVSVEFSESGASAPTLMIRTGKAVGTTHAIRAWGVLSREWSEGVIGAQTKVQPWLITTVGIGAGTDRRPLRVGGIISMELGNVSAQAIYEVGSGSHWHAATISYKVSDRLTVGAVSRRPSGEGGFAEFTLTKKVAVSLAVTREGKTTLGEVGVILNF